MYLVLYREFGMTIVNKRMSFICEDAQTKPKSVLARNEAIQANHFPKKSNKPQLT